MEDDGLDLFEEIARNQQKPGRDRPITAAWRLIVEPQKRGGIRIQRQQAANERLLGDLMVTHRSNPAACMSYPRRPEFFSSRRIRYWPKDLTFARLMNFVEGDDWGWAIENMKSRPGQRGTQSRMRLRESAAEGLTQFKAKLIYDPPEIIVLRGDDGRLVDYPETAEAQRLRFHLAEINEALSAANLGYQDRRVRTGDLVYIDGKPRVVHNELYRVFNRSLDLGGRLYGAWYQNMPSDERSRITMNGSETLENDYRQLHPRLLYAIAGKLLDGDAYEMDGWARPQAKAALNTIINAETELAALRSIATEIGGRGAFARARNLIERLKERHQPIADSFGSGAGLRLQRIDSDIAEQVQLRLIRRGIVSLPIHDSFIVEQRHSGVLREVMNDVVDEYLRRIAGTELQSSGYSKNVPQYGDTVSLSPDPSPGLGGLDIANDNQPTEIGATACGPDEAKRNAA